MAIGHPGMQVDIFQKPLTGFLEFWNKKRRSFGSDCIYWLPCKALRARVRCTGQTAEAWKKTLFMGETLR